ncbi:Uncharacterised protein [Serratia fonticola]|uniref:Uncharacterized protein n=1 Tax=Serratia fonticola TaxID=47917 RepID=A0A4U9URB3_SERFO|nr:Uncharacterised protein [Serratia fonticola]
MIAFVLNHPSVFNLFQPVQEANNLLNRHQTDKGVTFMGFINQSS